MSRDRHSRLGRYLASSRKKAKLSQSEVARVLGYSSAQFVSNWERGIASPPVSSLRKLARLYGVSAEELYEEIMSYNLDKLRTDMDAEFYGKDRKRA